MTARHTACAALLALALVQVAPCRAATAGSPTEPATAAATLKQPDRAPSLGTSVRVGDHNGFGRVVFDLPEGAHVHTVHEGDRLLLVFQGAGALQPASRLPRNVASMRAAPDAMVLQLLPGTRPHVMQLGLRLVVDVLDPKLPDSEPAPKRNAATAAASRTPPPATSRPSSQPAQQTSTPPGTPEPSPPPPAPVVQESQPALKPVTPPAAAPTPTIQVQGPVAPPPPRTATTEALATAAVVAVQRTALPPPIVTAAAVTLEPASAVTHPPGPSSPGPQPSPDVTTPQPATPPRPVSPTPPALFIPANRDVGAAAFPRGGKAVVVLDQRMSQPTGSFVLPDGGTWTEGAVSTTLSLPLAPGQGLKLERLRRGWSLQPVPDPLATKTTDGALPTAMPPLAMPTNPSTPNVPATSASTPAAAEHSAPPPPPLTPPANETLLPMAHPGRAVTILDPLTGGTLLVGTSRTPGSGSFVAQARSTPDYRVLPTWLGVVVDPIADRVDLRALDAGFVLAGAPRLPAAPATLQTRRFDLPDDSVQMLLNRLHAQLAGAADDAIRSRTHDRLAAAQTMVALGMGAEAEAVTRLVAAQDPQAANDATLVGLRSIAAVMAGRPAEAAGLDDPRLSGSDEIALWRGLRDRALGNETPAARGIADDVPLAMSYPPTLRRLVWPPVAEAAVQAGIPVPDGDLTPIARAMRLEHDGKIDAALAAYDAVADGPDRLLQVRAATRAVELRLAAGRMKPSDAATELERQAFVWRDGAREPRLRLRAAQLRGVAGQWRMALDGLRDLEKLFPRWAPKARSAKAAVLQAMLATDGGDMTPLNLVLLAAEYSDGVPSGPEGNALARLLVEKLLALDLPARAIPLLHGLMQAAPAGPARADIGVRLAQLLIDGGDPAAARTALDASSAPGLASVVTERRTLLLARILAKQGDTEQAAAGLVELGTDAADDLRATLLADAGDWRGSLQALSDLAAKRVPAEGPLSDAAQDVLLREATAAARVPDPAALQHLAAAASRMTPPRADLFRVLTAAPLASADDLPRTGRELKLARMLPQQVQALGRR